jgi:hypothetical protein
VKSQSLVFSRTVVVGEFPEDWEFLPMRFPEGTPGSVFMARVLERGTGAIPPRCRHREFAVTENPRTWAAYEVWVTCVVEEKGYRLLPSGRPIWRLHQPLKPWRLKNV